MDEAEPNTFVADYISEDQPLGHNTRIRFAVPDDRKRSRHFTAYLNDDNELVINASDTIAFIGSASNAGRFRFVKW